MKIDRSLTVQFRLQIKLMTIFLVVAIALTSFSSAYAAIQIWAPRQVNPAFVQPNGVFVAEIKGESSLSSSGWSVSLQNELRSWDCTVLSANYGTINRDTESGWRLTIQVPPNIPPELFKLNISQTTGGSASWVNAVSVVANFEADFYIVQFTDEHLKDEGGAQSMSAVAPVINLINPRFVLHTGDEFDDIGVDTENRVRWYLDAKKQYKVPCVTVPGNHDSYWDWKSSFGQQSFSFRMGSFYVLAHDCNSLPTFATNDYNKNWNDLSIKYRLIAQHAWINQKLSNSNIFIPDLDKPCNLMLMGHAHPNKIMQSEPYYALETIASPGDWVGGFFEFQKTGSGWSCISPLSTHESGSNDIKLYEKGPGVTATYVSLNDGTQTTNSVTIKNNIPRNFYDGRVKFLMASGTYKVSGGTKIAEYSYADGTKTAVLVKADIPKSAGSMDGAVTVTATKIAGTTAPKNIILCIGDGMGFEEVKAAGMYASGSAGALFFESFPYKGDVTTYSADSSVTDSAAAGTAIAAGRKVNNGVISMAFPGDGSELQTILEYFKNKGKSTGLVTTDVIAAATPAAFGAHETDRGNQGQIVNDYLTQTRPNVLFGGGGRGMETWLAQEAGYTVVTDSRRWNAGTGSGGGLFGLNTETENFVSGQFAYGKGDLPYESEYYDVYGKDLPHLSERTKIALDILDNDPDGLFLMLEGAMIDFAGHNSDLYHNIFETIEFSKSVKAAYDWAQTHPDTLIIVTADHETGGLAVLSSNGKGNFPNVTWTGGGGHTGVNVPFYAYGVNANLLKGTINNTDFFSLITSPVYLLYGDVSGDGIVSAYDAALTAQAAINLITLTPDQTKAADVSGDGKVSAYDAALIAQKVVGLIDKFPVE